MISALGALIALALPPFLIALMGLIPIALGGQKTSGTSKEDN